MRALVASVWVGVSQQLRSPVSWAAQSRPSRHGPAEVVSHQARRPAAPWQPASPIRRRSCRGPRTRSSTLPPGFAIDVFAEGGFKTLRWAMEGPGGEVFVTDTTANTITVLRDADKDGKAESRAIFAQGLDRPMGMAIHDGWFYVGNTDAILRWRYTAGQASLTGSPEIVAKVPGGGNHWTRTLTFSPDGQKLYVTVGSGRTSMSSRRRARRFSR